MIVAKRILDTLLVSLAACVLRVIRGTSRTQRVGWKRVETMRAKGRKFSFALWHGEALLMLPELQGEGCAALVSNSRDGEFAAALLRQFGYLSVRGSTSQGGASGLRGLLRVLARGATPAVTVDGPRGPAGQVAPGIAGLARLSNSWIIPLAASSSKSLRLSTWDQTQIPLPLSRNFVFIGRPIPVSRDSDDLTTQALLRSRLQGLQQRANRIAGLKGP